MLKNSRSIFKISYPIFPATSRKFRKHPETTSHPRQTSKPLANTSKALDRCLRLLTRICIVMELATLPPRTLGLLSDCAGVEHRPVYIRPPNSSRPIRGWRFLSPFCGQKIGRQQPHREKEVDVGVGQRGRTVLG